MSAGSANIVVQITDQVDSTIAPKIREIGSAAREANSSLVMLQTAVADLGGGSSKLSDALKSVRPALDDAGASTGRLTGAIAQLAGRVAGAEAGFGMLGGALARVGVAAGVAGPLIVAALAVAAVVGAVLIYNKLQDEASKLVAAQTEVAATTNDLNDKILEQSENLTGLVSGPLAKYRQELADLPFKSVKVDLADLNKEWKAQPQTINEILSLLDRYSAKLGAQLPLQGIQGSLKIANQPAPVTNKDVEQFVSNEELKRQQGQLTKSVTEADQKSLADDAAKYAEQSRQNNLVGLQNELLDVKNFIKEKQTILAQQDGPTAALTQQSIADAQQVYNRDLDALRLYEGQKKTIEAGANGDLLKEQRQAAANQLKEFNDELSKLKDASGVVTPQQTLQLRQQQLSGAPRPTERPGLDSQAALPGNKDTLDKDIGNAQQAVDRQNRSLDELITKYRDETLASGAYSVALKTEVEQRKAAAEVNKIAPGNTNDANVIKSLNGLIASKQHDLELSKEEVSIYDEFQGPLEKYSSAISASSILLAQHAISANQSAIADNAALRAKQDSLNPLNEYAIGLSHEIALLTTYGNALTVATEVDKIRQELQKTGRDLTVAESSALSQFLSQLNQQKQVQSDINSLYQTNVGNIEKLIAQQTALNTAQAKGIISQNQYQIATAQVNIALANQALAEGKAATVQDQLIAGIGKYLSGYQGVAKGLSDAYGSAFSTIANGAANSLGRAIAYGDNLGKSLLNVARSAVSELISSFIKLGIQWLVNEAIGATVGSTATASSLAQATALATAWAPAAAFASLASFGANAAPAATAVSGTVALSEALALVGSHSQGGLINGPGSGTSDSILGRLSNGEYVVNAQATAANRDILDSINGGASAVRANSSSASGRGGSPQLHVSVIHDGSTAISVQQMDDNRIRVIAKQEAHNAVTSQAPNVIASDLQNPNSRTSKALNQNTVIRRRR